MICVLSFVSLEGNLQQNLERAGGGRLLNLGLKIEGSPNSNWNRLRGNQSRGFVLTDSYSIAGRLRSTHCFFFFS